MDFLPKDISNEIFEFYDTKCLSCGEEMVLCKDCELYFCKIHICFNHQTCSVCSEHACPFKKFERICNCHQNLLCRDCYYTDLPLRELGILDLLGFSEVDSLVIEIEE